MISKLIEVIEKSATLTGEDKELLGLYFEEIDIPRKAVLVMPGDIPEYLYFIVDGFARLCYSDQHGYEHTTPTWQGREIS